MHRSVIIKEMNWKKKTPPPPPNNAKKTKKKKKKKNLVNALARHTHRKIF